MAAAPAGYRKGLVSAGWLIFCLLAQTSTENGPFTLYALFLAF